MAGGRTRFEGDGARQGDPLFRFGTGADLSGNVDMSYQARPTATRLRIVCFGLKTRRNCANFFPGSDHGIRVASASFGLRPAPQDKPYR